MPACSIPKITTAAWGRGPAAGARLLWIGVSLMLVHVEVHGDQLVRGRRSLVFENPAATLVIDLAGGSIVDFHFKDQPLNPLSWGTPAPNDTGARGFGHFLCLDRWGPPSEAEGANGMPYHGEAATVIWQTEPGPTMGDQWTEAVMRTRLPMAGLSLRRVVRWSRSDAVFTVREEVTNENRLGRIYNAVQHPTIGPPFLDETTLVDSNGREGFAQGGRLPEPERPSFYWPQAFNRDGGTVNMRRLTDDPHPNVVTYAIDDDHGWVTAAAPRHGLLVGYFWQTRDYPWLSLWRDVQAGKPAARGLEFGTTGLHQPYPILTRKGRIFGRALFEHLDAGETAVRSYAGFLLKIPADYSGVQSVNLENDRLKVRERREHQARDLSLDTGRLLSGW